MVTMGKLAWVTLGSLADIIKAFPLALVKLEADSILACPEELTFLVDIDRLVDLDKVGAIAIHGGNLGSFYMIYYNSIYK